MLDILSLIPYGKENAVTKQSLAVQLNRSERDVRNMIAELRKEGEVIISSSHGKGYYKPRKSEAGEVMKFVAEQNSRANEIRLSTAGARKWLAGNSGQQEMDFSA